MARAATRAVTILRTARLELRPVGPPDADRLLAFFNDPDVGRYLLDGAPVSSEWVRGEIEASRSRFADGGAGLWTLRRREDPSGGAGSDPCFVGVVGFRPFFDPPELQLLYALDPGAWGRGLATEAAAAAIGYAFGALGHPEVRAATDEPNAASIAVLERLGMRLWKREGERPSRTLFYRVAAAGWSAG